LRFDNASSKATGANADAVLGQPNFTSSNCATSQSGMCGPIDVILDSGGRLWVAEYNNSRVLRFDNATTSPNGDNADGVLGQPDFTTSSAAITQTKMAYLWALYVDSGGRLWVSDQGPRVLRFDDAANSPNGDGADGVLGQPDFTSSGGATTQSKFNFTAGVYGDDSGRIFVSDWANRVLVFNNAASKANGANADNVIGQVNFTSGGAAATQAGMGSPMKSFFDPAANVLWVADSGYNRVLMYGSVVTASPTVTIIDPIDTNGGININFTVSDLGYPIPVSAYGVVYGTAVNPTTSDSTVDKGSLGSTGSFTIGNSDLTLTPGTQYHVRAFATNGNGTSYSADRVFYGPPADFTTTAPANNATGVSTSPTLSWNASTGATDYEYCYAPASEAPLHCMNPADPGWISTSGATSAVLSGLTTNTKYVWGVRAVVGTPASYNYSSDSPLFFTTVAIVNHTVTFDGNGADGGSMSPQIASSATNLTANAFTRTGYTFTGWGTAAGGPVVYTDGASYDFSADITLYAQWSAGTQSTTFQDVPASHWAYSYIERLYTAGITGGCGTSPLTYCPDATVTRAQMAIFILRGMHGNAYTPPAATGTVFADVPADAFAADWIEQLAAEGVTSGCGDGNYCPDASITRAQMAIFLLRGEHGAAYTPADAVGTVYLDVPADAFAAAWIEQLAREGVTGGCGGGNYCPDAAVTRAEMAVFIVRAFGLP